jgi:hypothetical protein
MRIGQPGTLAEIPPDREGPAGPPPDALIDDEAGIRTDSLDVSEDVGVADSLPEAADSVGAATDSIPVADSLAAGEPEAGAPDEPERPGRPPGLGSAEARERPFPFLIVTLEQALTEDTFRVSVSGVSNLRGLTGGGDTTFVYVAPLPALAPAEPAEDGSGISAADDSTGAVPEPPSPESSRSQPDDES